ncbi:2-oxo-4-hydroxy-4-carboxy-5-ureidoimidazoline decarboxylase [Rhizosaccharibacter radicis]|uniref:2-oxo-4-hydroxy-4-carboxy-5-ureidoimidazoline decarboxylase n=1 Tax=Rhizosaccharibacter radicis TaxID=2782605 RepID=A0ABT1VYB5_9PROT|nr:2-oxo-4-hydroxy-4-carboxy-5-ureidoimidazoline decarboxylase [Acetobacteraceae bacterium KSS12]
MSDPLISFLAQADKAGFISRLGALYEHSPWIAAEAWSRRPFADRDALRAALRAVVDEANEARQLQLIRAHPDLAGKLARAGTLEAHSTREQQGLGLDRLDDAEYRRFDSLNTAYRERFGFPFIVAVRAHTRDSVLAAFESRLRNTPDQERRAALREIHQIAAFRLSDLS